MKTFRLFPIALAIVLLGCGGNANKPTETKGTDTITATDPPPVAKASTPTDEDPNKTEIRTLMQEMFTWAESKDVVGLLPAITKDSVCIGFDMKQVGGNVEAIKKTGLFAEEFTANYKHIMQTLDEKIKSGQFAKWNINDLPTFRFANDESPWCSCQDNYPWENMDIADLKITGNTATANWNWGLLPENVDPSWKAISTPFKVVKEDGKWKISYLKGFDYKESVR